MLSFREYKVSEHLKENIIEYLEVCDGLLLEKIGRKFLIEDVENLRKSIIQTVKTSDEKTLNRINGIFNDEEITPIVERIEKKYSIASGMTDFKNKILLSTEPINVKMDFLKILDSEDGVLSLTQFKRGTLIDLDNLIEKRLKARSVDVLGLYDEMREHIMKWKPEHQKTAEGHAELFLALFMKEGSLQKGSKKVNDKEGNVGGTKNGDIKIKTHSYEIKAYNSRLKGSGNAWVNPAVAAKGIGEDIEKDIDLLIEMERVSNQTDIKKVVTSFGFNDGQIKNFNKLKLKERRKAIKIYINRILPKSDESSAMMNELCKIPLGKEKYSKYCFNYYMDQVDVSGIFFLNDKNSDVGRVNTTVMYLNRRDNFIDHLGNFDKYSGFSYSKGTDANSVYQYILNKMS